MLWFWNSFSSLWLTFLKSPGNINHWPSPQDNQIQGSQLITLLEFSQKLEDLTKRQGKWRTWKQIRGSPSF